MAYKEIKNIVRNVKKRLKQDENRPYNIRAKNGDAIDRFGKEAFEFRTIDKMLTQPLGTAEFSRLSEGDKRRTWRFGAVIPPEKLALDDQVQYKGDWFEVKKINDWDSIMSVHMVRVT